MSYREVDAQKQNLKDFLKGLTRTDKLFVVFYYHEEMTIPEIAKVLELPQADVLQMHSSIIARCKSYLQKKGLL